MKYIDLPLDQLQQHKDAAVKAAKASNMKDEALNSKAFALQDIYEMKLRREVKAGRSGTYQPAK